MNIKLLYKSLTQMRLEEQFFEAIQFNCLQLRVLTSLDQVETTTSSCERLRTAV